MCFSEECRQHLLQLGRRPAREQVTWDPKQSSNGEHHFYKLFHHISRKLSKKLYDMSEKCYRDAGE